MNRFKFIFSIPKTVTSMDVNTFFDLSLENDVLEAEAQRFFEHDVEDVISIEHKVSVDPNCILDIYTVCADKNTVDHEIVTLRKISDESPNPIGRKFLGAVERTIDVDTGSYIWRPWFLTSDDFEKYVN